MSILTMHNSPNDHSTMQESSTNTDIVNKMGPENVLILDNSQAGMNMSVPFLDQANTAPITSPMQPCKTMPITAFFPMKLPQKRKIATEDVEGEDNSIIKIYKKRFFKCMTWKSEQNYVHFQPLHFHIEQNYQC